jgi:hypothetical protein
MVYKVDEDDLTHAYHQSKSVKAKRDLLSKILKNSKIKKSKADALVEKITPLVIPAGTKAKIRGDRLNTIVGSEIRKILKRIRKKDIAIEFEKPNDMVHEIPDWSIYDKKTGKRIIGYNQMDLWNGGQQINRGGKYILDDTLHDRLRRKNAKLCCIVYNSMDIGSKKNTKKRRIIETGIKKKRLMYCDNTLREFILDYFR